MQAFKRRVLMSFTVFAMFFGAGNLIFPVFLAYQAGDNVIPAFTGFALSATALPVLALIAVTKEGDLDGMAGRVHPVFSRILTIAVYLAIGPCLAIPRTASTSYKMAALAAGNDYTLSAIIYSAVFFTLAGIVALRPEKLSKRLGRFLSPLLVLLIAILFAGTAVSVSQVQLTASEVYDSSPLAEGFVEGYQTMDAIAGLVFGSILAINITKAGVDEKEVRKECAIAAAGGGILLLIVYSALAVTGTLSHAFITSPANGADILSAAAASLWPQYGRYFIAAIFILACFNTCTGLLSSCGEYFSNLIPSVSRAKWIALFSVISLAIAVSGLDTIISISSPVLENIYPVAVTLMVLTVIPQHLKGRMTYIIPVATALVFSVVATITGMSFLWILPVLAATVITSAVHLARG